MMYGNNFATQKMPDFNVKIYKGDNSISLAQNDSGLLSSVQGTKVNEMIMIANTKQFLSYHMLRIISESFNYLDYNIYNIINNYVTSLDLMSFIKENAKDALKLNILAEIYKVSELLFCYQKPLVGDMEKIKEEITVMVDKMMSV